MDHGAQSHDIQCVETVRRLRAEAATTACCYSNVDLAELFKSGIEVWHPTQPSVGVSDRGALLDMALRNGENEIRIQLVLVDTFQTACHHLLGYLKPCSLPINEAFPKSSGKPGEIRLDTTPGASNPIVIWVYHNIFIRVELFESGHKQSDISPNSGTCPTLFDKVVDKLCQYIRSGSVQDRTEIARPETVKIKPPDSTKVGETFDVEVTADLTHFHDVKCRM